MRERSKLQHISKDKRCPIIRISHCTRDFVGPASLRQLSYDERPPRQAHDCCEPDVRASGILQVWLPIVPGFLVSWHRAAPHEQTRRPAPGHRLARPLTRSTPCTKPVLPWRAQQCHLCECRGGSVGTPQKFVLISSSLPSQRRLHVRSPPLAAAPSSKAH